ncbi:MAG: type II secretion system F family protein [Pirellulales bacterium]
MPEYLYRAKTSAGLTTGGSIVATSRRDALSRLTQQALFPLEVTDAATAGAWKLADFKGWFGGRVKSEVIADTLTQLADLLNNGVSLLESLNIMATQSADRKMREVLTAVRSAVADGRNLDEALAAHPAVFSHLTISMVRAGLEGAFLEESLERVSGFLRKQHLMRSRIIGAMIYPAILAGVGLSVTMVLMLFVVPRFEGFFERLERSGVGLPKITQILLFVSHSLARYWIVVLVVVAGLFVTIRALLSTPRGQRWSDRAKLKIPLVGEILHDAAVSRFCRVLGTLLANGVPILKSLQISSSSAGNSLLEEAIQQSAKNISTGNLLSQPLASSGLIPPQTMAMIRVAEESNSLDAVLVRIADRTDQKVEQRLEVLVRLIEPLMLLIIGGVVMFIIAAMLLPIMDLSSAVE